MSIESLESRALLDAAKLLVTEFSAANDTGIRDEDGDRSDWIELFNAGDEAANLDGWFLTDNAEQPTKWRLPPKSLDPGAYEVIFASGKDRTDVSSPLHTNFKLSSAGEYLALVDPDGETKATEYAPTFPAQIGDYTFGTPQAIVNSTLLPAGTPASVFIPKDDSLGTTWTEVGFDDSQWTAGTTGVGFGRSTGFPELLATDIKLDMIRARNSSAYVRIPFTAQNPELTTSFILSMKYDDGFVAYLNGVEVARRNAPDEVVFDSTATQAHPNVDAIVPEIIDLTDSKSLLIEGDNVLAIQGLNLRFTDSDFLIMPEISVKLGGELQTGELQYFPDPTPGQPNGSGVTMVVSELSHTPNVPDTTQDLTVTASITSTVDESVSLMLRYRVMYQSEVEVPMLDDGLNGDGLAGDGVYGATIPAGVATPGKMIRYYVTAQQQTGDTFRTPNFRDPLDSEQYRGTVVQDPDVESSKLPVMQIFMQNPSGANTREGTRGSLFFDGEFYDNVRIDLHGNLTAGFPRKSRDIDFPRDHRFNVPGDSPRANDINLLTNYTDPSKMRSDLVYGAFEWAGAGTHLTFPVRTELNGNFYAIYDYVEDGDDRFLERIGRDPKGALYNMSGPLNSLAGAEKRSGVQGDFSDLQSLVDGLKLEGDERKQYLYDNVNMPALANYLATLIITSYGDCCGKNYYVYQDTFGTGEWEALPWDVNIALGGFSNTFDEMRTDRSLFTGSTNDFFKALYDDPGFNEMYLRRLRTLMDEIYGPPGTLGKFDQRIDELAVLLAPDAPMDEAKLAPIDDRRGKSWEYYVDILRNGFVNGRREFLYNTQTVSGGGPIPEAQPTDATLAFGQVEVSPASGNQNEEFIQLTNPNDYAVDVSRWSLSGPISMQIKPGTVIPAGGSLYLSPNVNAFRARASGPSGDQGLFVQGPYTDKLSSAGGVLKIIDPSGRVAASIEVQGESTPAEQFLRVTEVMYNPTNMPGRGFDASDFEFIELRNTSDSTPIDLSSVRISGGIQFDFSESSVSQLEAGQFVLVVKDQIAFEARYGSDVTIAGQFDGRLSDSGDRIDLSEGGTAILSFDYRDDWYPATDGGGRSLVIVNALAETSQWNVKTQWNQSSTVGGDPGNAASRVPGDSNGDGQFDSADLVQVLAAGKYEDNVLQNSTFEEGDWNGDGEFNSADLIFVFQAGTFVAEARAEENSVAAAVAFQQALDDLDSKTRPGNGVSRTGL